MGDTATLVIMRHGQSAWTDRTENRFAGWVDVGLTEEGRRQAVRAGHLIADAGLHPDVAFTSVMRRAIVTADLVLDQVDRLWVPVLRTWRLNERHYGAFQGQTRPAMRERYGDEAFAAYRRSFDARPPEIALDSPYYQGSDPRYAPALADGLDGIDPARIRAESLSDVCVRLRPFWDARIAPALASGRTVLIATHGSVVRALIKELEGLSAEDIRAVDVPTGVPRAYVFETGPDGRPHPAGPGRYLDEAAARAGIDDVAALGRAGAGRG